MPQPREIGSKALELSPLIAVWSWRKRPLLLLGEFSSFHRFFLAICILFPFGCFNIAIVRSLYRWSVESMHLCFLLVFFYFHLNVSGLSPCSVVIFARCWQFRKNGKKIWQFYSYPISFWLYLHFYLLLLSSCLYLKSLT